MNTESQFVPLTGHCRCEQVRFRIETAPIITHCCHCRLCQAFSGSAFRTVAMIETEHITVLTGTTRAFEAKGTQKQSQCSSCGTTLWSHLADLGEGVAFVGIGLLDEPGRLPPEAHYFVRSKHPWIVLPEGVPAFQERGDPGKTGAKDRIMAVFAKSKMVPQRGDWGIEKT